MRMGVGESRGHRRVMAIGWAHSGPRGVSWGVPWPSESHGVAQGQRIGIGAPCCPNAPLINGLRQNSIREHKLFSSASGG